MRRMRMAEDRAVEVICPECGERIKVADVEAFIRAIHLQQSCEAMVSILGTKA
jgi:hypothetical protein